jgi:hypothetical protein
MKNATLNYENTFFLGGTALSGVLSVDGSYNIDYKPINVIGQGFVKQVISSIPTAELSLSRYLVSDDPVLNLTGQQSNFSAVPISAGLYYKNKYFAFQNGYLKSIGISCSVGEIPQIESSFDVFGNIGPNFNPSGNNYAGSVFVPQVKNISITCRNSTSNRVKDFNINFNNKNLPIYVLRSSSSEIPVEVSIIGPIEVETSFTLDIDDYETKQLFSDLSSNGVTSFTINVNGTILNDLPLTDNDGVTLQAINSSVLTDLFSFLKIEDSVPLFNFTNSNAIIQSEQVSSSSDDVVGVKLSYKTYLN